eukprot:CAMPEP_0204898360 /NCGR_PEP_ID=MMETSP1397-20131031/1247_1 /ASSEMBLY_ACC=CAM_ASM_000891 /TAXON_ID=49980 /ORGANISM="Climacostomum Climacostomum virens, Strain Stock W-24" /LENGTH=125 /DNA_ID=CAMNT_0052066195 /DNA_START=48 /DNA_END=422 /DNA_ORIENTATION=+
MTCLKNRVFYIVPSTSKPSRQLYFKEQEWRELPPLPEVPEMPEDIRVSAFELTEKLYVYQFYREFNFIQELDLNTLRWRTIPLPYSVKLECLYPIFFPGESSLILVNDDADVIRIDPEQATISKV